MRLRFIGGANIQVFEANVQTVAARSGIIDDATKLFVAARDPPC